MYDHVPESVEEYSAQKYGMKTDRTPFGRPDARDGDLVEGTDDSFSREHELPSAQYPYMEEPEYTRMEKLSAMMGALTAALAIGAVYAIGLGIVIVLMVMFWK